MVTVCVLSLEDTDLEQLVVLAQKRKWICINLQSSGSFKSLLKKHQVTKFVLGGFFNESNIFIEFYKSNDLNIQCVGVNGLTQIEDQEFKIEFNDFEEFLKLEDSQMIYNAGIQDEDINFDKLINSIPWTQMYAFKSPVPRLICVQYKPNPDKLEPIYRHPTDCLPIQKPFDPVISAIAIKLSKLLNCPEFNHVLIQLYRSGEDNISAHSDKTLDLLPNSPIVNYTLGASRDFRIILKEDKNIYETFSLSNDSIFVLGQKTNRMFWHEIRPDRRPDNIKSEEELNNGGQRISFTFRCIGTFKDIEGNLVGQGAPKDKLNKQDDSREIIQAFGLENKSIDFDWNETYGKGFYWH